MAPACSGGDRLPNSLLALHIHVNWDRVLGHGARIAVIAVIAILAIAIIERLVEPLVRIAIREQMAGQPQIEVDKRIATLTNVTSRTIATAITIAAILTALPELGINVAPLVASIGIVGLAVGFGAQNLVRDVITGLFILIENQYAKGDMVTIAGVSGVVEDMNLRRTVLRDMDGSVHFVAHSQVQVTTNQTKGLPRVNITVSVRNDASIDQAFAVINRIGEEMARDPRWGQKISEAPRARRVEKLTDTTIDIRVTGVAEPREQWSVMGELRRRLAQAFETEGLTPKPESQEAKSGGQAR